MNDVLISRQLHSEISKESVKIFSELPVYRSVEGHYSAAPFLISADMFGGLDFEMVGKDISPMVGQSVAEPHVHSYPEIYLLVSPQPGNAKILVETSQGNYVMTSPATAFIPAYVQHRFIVQEASLGSFCFGILLKNKDIEKAVRQQTAGEIFTSAIASNAILVLESTGILKVLDEETKLYEDDKRIQELNALVILASVKALVRSQILNRTVDRKGTYYSFTHLGKEVYQNIGSFVLWLNGYRNVIAQQIRLASSPFPTIDENNTDGVEVARSSAMLGKKYIDSEVINFITHVKPKGKICDLGCGNGSRLIQICKMTHTSGLGIDFSEGAIREAIKQPLQDTNVNFRLANVTALTEPMPDVDVFMQAFLTHHFLPDDFCIRVFKHYHQIFPRARYFLLLETVDENQLEPNIFYPGFEYLHSLRGVRPRTYDEMIKIIKDSGYVIEKETKLDLPNCYFWGLKINH